MNILINASNLKLGGGIQVADSICRSLDCFPQHHFYVVLSDSLGETRVQISNYQNVTVYGYNIPNNLSVLAFGRDAFLDRIVKEERIDCALTVFGPSRWDPRCPHICGFARLQLVFPESPFYARMGLLEKFKKQLSNALIKYLFTRKTKEFWCENAWVSKRVDHFFGGVRCHTVTNYYNQVFDYPERWINLSLPSFKGVTVLNIGANYPHKILGIIVDMASIFMRKYPEVAIRFVLTLDASSDNKQMTLDLPDDVRNYFLLIGKVDIEACPALYQQSDILFQPSLLECFTATYPEAMRMQVPIVTTDLEFALGLCGEAALYYDPLDPEDAVEKMMTLINNPMLSEQLKKAGLERLKSFDNYEQRVSKLISLCECVGSSN